MRKSSPPPVPGSSEMALQRMSLVRMSSLQAGGRKGDVRITGICGRLMRGHWGGSKPS